MGWDLRPIMRSRLLRRRATIFFLFNHNRIQPIGYGGTLFYLVPVCRPGPKVGLDGCTEKSKQVGMRLM